MRIALGVEYNGASYLGWQSQPNGNTVQDVLEKALAQVAGHPVRTLCAGRTDTGVHGLGQVVHFDTGAERPISAWVRGVNRFLPATVAVQWALPVPEAFHARASARSRRYRYLLLNRAVRPALLAGRVGWHHRPLDVAAMAAAAPCLIGTHDFTAFRAAECQAASPVKTLLRAEIRAQGELLVFDFQANAFLHHMVRNLVGSLVYVGKGRHPPEWLAAVLAGRERSLAAPTFDPAGLYFAGVDYDPVWGIPAPPDIIAG